LQEAGSRVAETSRLHPPPHLPRLLRVRSSPVMVTVNSPHSALRPLTEDWESIFGANFTLRCFQCLSLGA